MESQGIADMILDILDESYEDIYTRYSFYAHLFAGKGIKNHD